MDAVIQAIDGWFQFAAVRLPELWFRTGEHLVLTGLSTGLAIAIGVPLGLLATTARWLRTGLLGLIGVFQTIPSLAMLAILLTLVGRIGALPAVIALTIYALLPIVRNTVTGIEGVAADVSEAARGIGMTRAEQLRMVELPLALPVIVAGIRTAAVVGVGVATLSAFIGAGGLGQFINRGLALSNTQLILLGAIPAAILAILVDGIVAAAAWGLEPVRQGQRGTIRARLKPVAVAMPMLLVIVGVYAATAGRGLPGADEGATIRVGSKNFTEQIILAEMMAQMIEAETDLSVERRFNLGGTMICHEALVAGEIDVYPEYTGTGLVTILKRRPPSKPDSVGRIVREEYRKRFDVEWLDPFGFDNTYAITVRKADARKNRWQTISDLASAAQELAAGFTAEFAERPDGYPGLRERYGFRFGDVRDLDPALMYRAIANGEVDAISAFNTDGRIAMYDLQPLKDDRRFFPPYHAAPVVRVTTLKKHPEVGKALARLSGILDDDAMRQLNHTVDEKGRRVDDVVREFLQAHGLL